MTTRKVLLRILVAVLAAPALIAQPALAQLDLTETTPAIYAGDFVHTCSDYTSDAFWDIGLGECWSCPAGTGRTLASVKGAKACKGATRVSYNRANIESKKI